MGWFDDQIEFRKKHEREFLSDSFESIARSVTGRKIRKSLADQEDVSDAVSALLKHMGVKEREVPPTVKVLETVWIISSPPQESSTGRSYSQKAGRQMPWAR